MSYIGCICRIYLFRTNYYSDQAEGLSKDISVVCPLVSVHLLVRAVGLFDCWIVGLVTLGAR